jgi:hypothetical protein
VATTVRVKQQLFGGTAMTITLILSLLVCIAGLGLVATGMVLPLLLLPDEPGGSPESPPALRRFPGKAVTVRA